MRCQIELEEYLSRPGPDGTRWVANRATGNIRYEVAGVWTPWIKRESRLGRAADRAYRATRRARYGFMRKVAP